MSEYVLLRCGLNIEHLISDSDLIFGLYLIENLGLMFWLIFLICTQNNIFIYYLYLCSNFNADSENLNNGMGNSMGRGSNRPRGTSSRGRGTRHDFYNNSKLLFNY